MTGKNTSGPVEAKTTNQPPGGKTGNKDCSSGASGAATASSPPPPPPPPSAKPKVADLIDEKAKKHILDGDETGGGHRPGTKKPDKSEFPSGWSDEKILEAIADVATDPNSVPGPNNSKKLYTSGSPPKPIRNTFTGVRDGVEIKVVFEEATGRVVSGYPVRVVDPKSGALVEAPRNPGPT